MAGKTKPVSVRGAARRAQQQDAKLRRTVAKVVAAGTPQLNAVSGKAWDSFQNWAANMGIGTDSLDSQAIYGLNPITNVRTQLEWIHRGSWLGGVAVDLVADDMTRAGVSLKGELTPEDIEAAQESAISWGVWNSINETIRWGRLYGGCIAVFLIDGQDMSTPFRIETVSKGQFRGLAVFDRWMLQPSLERLVKTMGPMMGQPEFYTVLAQTPALAGKKIHYTRCIRILGVKLPYWQALTQNLWSISVLERLYDRMVAFDSATTGAAQLVHKSYLRVIKIKGLREIVGTGGSAMIQGLTNYVDMMRKFQSIEGITMLDAEDDFEGHGQGAVSFGGLSDALVQFGQQLAGALQIPLVRLFGQSPVGMNATGESDLRTYYDGILQQQESQLRVGVTNIYRCIAQSLGIKLPKGFSIQFNPLWQLTEQEKADIATKVTSSVVQAEEAGLIGPSTAMEELRQSSEKTGIFSNITDEDITAVQSAEPPVAQRIAVAEIKEGEEPEAVGNKQAAAKDNAGKIAWYHGLQVVVENPAGTVRRGRSWTAYMPADYGYIRRVPGADGDALDCYVGPSPESDKVFVINQRKLNGSGSGFDEHKVMLGYYAKESAVEDYVLGCMDGTGIQRMMNVVEMDMVGFKQWLTNGDTMKPLET